VAFGFRFSGSILLLRMKCLDKFAIVAQRHLNHITREFQVHYNREQPHEACGHLPPGTDPPSTLPLILKPADVVCTTRLGGLLKSYGRRAG
jgi:putative transposase